MVLGDRAEDAFRQSMILSKGSLLVFWSNPLAGTIATLALFCFALPALTAVRRCLRRSSM
jgi:TctA family transporter